MKIVPIKVDYLDHMGTDLDVVNAARVSFHKESTWNLRNPRAIDEQGNPIAEHSDKCISVQDDKLIQYLAKHNHWSPFSHCFVKFRIKAPIFVARQLQKHTVGLAWNEVSRRYVDEEPEFFVPDVWRARAENVKQGSSQEEVVAADSVNTVILYKCLNGYNELIRLGVCPEQARMILPQNTMTEWIWSGSLYAFARVCLLRLDSHSQKETQEVAAAISRECNRLFPFSWEALVHKDSD
jgi:thymidylate synthase (FAD)